MGGGVGLTLNCVLICVANLFGNQIICFNLSSILKVILLVKIGACLPFPSLNKDLPPGQAMEILAYFHPRHQKYDSTSHTLTIG